MTITKREKVNRSPKSIDLKATDFFTTFYIFCESGIKIFLQWHPLTGPLLKL